ETVTAVIARSHLACVDVYSLLGPCADGELLEEDGAAVRAHVAQCASCSARLEQMRRLKRTIAAAALVTAPELPEGLVDDVRASIHLESRRDRRARAGVVAAAVAMCAVLGVVLFAKLDVHAAAPAVAVPLNLVDAVVARHRLDVPVDVASTDPARVQQFLASRVGPKLRVPHLEQTGFGLQGGRVVDVNERRGAQLVYTGGFGQRISVVALPDPDGAFARSVRAPLATSADGLAVRMLAGDGDDARIESVVNAIER